MRRFYSTDIRNDSIYLDQDESRHLKQVLRAKEGDQVEVVNGKGNLYQCEIIKLEKKECELRILEFSFSEKSLNLWMAVSPTKNINRWEWFLEKATEIGISRISPILCENSERKHLKYDRQIRILKEAMKQSHQLHLPELDEMTSFDTFLKEAQREEKYIAHCYEGEKEKLLSAHQKNKNTLILIGPEGDFSRPELESAISKGFLPISLGESRLRTETAAIAACHTISLLDD